MKYPRVLYIGGAPMVGKTTISRIIGARLQYGLISTDDIGAGIAAVTDPSSHPAFHYMENLDYREYYIEKNNSELILDINNQHQELWPALLKLFENHSTWDSETIIEGWALRPSYVSNLTGDISGIFLLSEDSLIEKRIRANSFSTGSSDPEKMIQNYLERSLWYNRLIRDQVIQMGLNKMSIYEGMEPDFIADECMKKLMVDENL
jgi:2-phosphoglycerate kinase